MIEKSAEPIGELSHAEAAQGRWKTMGVEIAVAAVCAIAAVIAWVTAYDVAGFVMTVRPATKLANPPKISKLILMLAMLVGAGSTFLAAAWQTWRPNSIHRQVASGWSLTFTAFWILLGLYVFFICYPLPYHSHHIDKLLLYGALVLAWVLLFAFRPDKLAVWLNGRVYEWIKVGLVNALVFVALGEVTLRVIDPLLARSGLFGDKQTPANLKPHAKVWGTIGFSNSQGFRDRERTVQRTSPAPRIIALGDSFTYGAGVSYDQTFVTLVEHGMQREFPGAEVINLGVPGWETPEEVHLLKVYGIKFQPDLVMLNFCVGNDIVRRRGVFLEEPIVVAGHSYYVHSVGNWVHDSFGPDRWYLYHNLNYVFKVGMNHVQRLQVVQKEDLGFGVPWKPRKAYFKDIDNQSEVYLKESTAVFEQHWRRTRAALERMQQFLHERHIPLMIVLIPAHEQHDDQLQKEFMAALGTSPDRYDFEKPQRILKEWGNQHGVSVIDLLPNFKQLADPAVFYFQNDMHWNAAGHALAAANMLPHPQKRLHEMNAARSGSADGVVIWFLYTGNDLDDDYGDTGNIEDLPWKSGFSAWKVTYKTFRRQSPIRQITDNLLSRLKRSEEMAKKVLKGHLPDGRPVLFLKSQEEWSQRTRAEVERHHNFSKLVRTMEAMRLLTEQKSLKLVIVVLPTKGEVYPWILHGKNRLPEETLPSGFSQAVLSACDELGLRCFDAKPYFMQEAKRRWSSDGQLLWWRDDTHLGEPGHEALTEFLTREILPRDS